ncbi:hypothetical protein K2173_005150 [Erythroxylum novogranatense]|uniref:Uncharacterized protein n=1 Tax=Erythroxylum novogranatense TaxID=1862640 RepID=A0AAV8TRL6_9ROSI|nr:hypothetical protein K2173_005150 [Erythroxylum novogranatense]
MMPRPGRDFVRETNKVCPHGSQFSLLHETDIMGNNNSLCHEEEGHRGYDSKSRGGDTHRAQSNNNLSHPEQTDMECGDPDNDIVEIAGNPLMFGQICYTVPLPKPPDPNCAPSVPTEETMLITSPAETIPQTPRVDTICVQGAESQTTHV